MHRVLASDRQDHGRPSARRLETTDAGCVCGDEPFQDRSRRPILVVHVEPSPTVLHAIRERRLKELAMARPRFSVHWFSGLDDARRTIEDWRRDYNETRPHSSLGDLAPAMYVAELLGLSQAAQP